jgi:FtsZ-interacting cell division protein ZipA
MMGYWLDKVLGADNDTDNFTKLVPLVIFFVIWVVGAIAKARSGKKGVEEKPAESKDKHQPGFDKLAKKIRERYTTAREQARRGVEQEENEQFQPPAMAPQPKPAIPRRPEPMAPPMYAQEGPTLRVVKGLEQTSVGDHLETEKPTMQKVESALHKVDALTSENAKASGEVVIHHQHPYLAELAEQYATQDGFRKAILNYEILGPPLALRDYVYCGAVEAR